MFSHGQGAVNQVAAVPSLHSAFVALVAFFLWGRVRPWVRPLLLLYPLAMGLTLIATGEHYFFDVAARLGLRGRGDGRLGLVGTPPRRARRGRSRRRAVLGLRQRRLERVDRLDRQRVDPAGRGEPKRDQVAEHHRREEPRRARLALGLDPHHLGAAGGDRLGGQLEAAAQARVLVGVFEHDGREPRALGRPGPAADLVVVGLGQLGEEGVAASRSR